MVFDKIETLKENGDVAFAEEKYDEATKHYFEAIALLQSQVHSQIADMYSKCVEAHLKQEKYELAIRDADQALKLDPNSVDCLFYRATAKLKLDMIKEAVIDLRKLLKLDPHHSKANPMLRELVPPTKLDMFLRTAFVGHYLRRPLLNPCGTDAESKKYFWRVMKVPILRMTFLSDQNAHSARRLFAGITVAEMKPNSEVSLRLPAWFIANHLMCDFNSNNVVNAILSKQAAILMLQLLKPADATLSFLSVKFVGEFGKHKFSNVIYQDEDKFFTTDDHVPVGFEIIKGAVSSLTRLPYFQELAKYEGDFPKLKCIIFASPFTVNSKVLKAWFEYMWPVKHLVYSDVVPDLSAYKRVNKYPICERVQKLHLPFANLNTNILSAKNFINDPITQLEVLKRAFPGLKEVVGTLDFKFERYEIFSIFVSNTLKGYVKFLAAQINKQIKPQWCEKLKILVNVVDQSDSAESMRSEMSILANVFVECRKEIKGFKSMDMFGPSAVSFDWNADASCFALMEFETADAEFQIAFKSIPKNP